MKQKLNIKGDIKVRRYVLISIVILIMSRLIMPISIIANENTSETVNQEVFTDQLEKTREYKSELEIIAPNSITVGALMGAAANILIKAGFGWLATQLYEWGAAQFCESYKNSNWATSSACSLLGY
ncbi:hypothetical protein [Ruoffia tabacinasalis]|uniref:Uncharacterized protein n=1 Tax=Ruoffia tabacinasalis TaxID=87458 RepID=A0ABS0LIP1_9LACT|nr:hypothetical protein [Ruoffia tabacinasalis]MBG9977291.1 hypothetical protein [Ruoffia tabacinasalis]